MFLAISLWLATASRVTATNITLISFTFTGSDTDGFTRVNPAYDVVARRVRQIEPGVLQNFTHIPVRCFNESITVGEIYQPGDFHFGDYDYVLEVPLEDVAGACFARFYYLRPELFSTDLSKHFTIVTTPTMTSEAAAELATFMAETPAVFALSTPDNSIADNTKYPTTFNLFGTPDESFSQCLAIVAQQFQWTGVNLVCDPRPNESFINYQCQKFGNFLHNANKTVYSSLQYTRYNITVIGDLDDDNSTENYTGVLSSILNRRVTLVMLDPDLVRDFMIAAYLANLTTGDYIFVTFAVLGVPSKNAIYWQANDSNDGLALKAFQALLVVQESGAGWNGSRALAKEINIEYRNRYSNWSLSLRDQSTIVPMRILEWMLVLTENLKSVNLTDITMPDFVRHCANRTYHLPTRTFFVSARGTMEVPSIIYKVDPDGAFQPFLSCDLVAATATLVPDDPDWFGWSTLPSEIPKCGLHFEKCADNAASVSAIAICVTLFVLLVGFLQRYMRSKCLENRLSHLVIDRKNITEPENDISNSEQKRTDQKCLREGKDRKNSARTDLGDASLGLPAVYRENSVYFKSLAGNQSMKSLTKEQNVPNNIVALSRLRHQYIAEFYGICLEQSALYVVFERPAKGSMKDVLADNIHFHDLELRLTMVANIIEGLQFIHTTDLKYHGLLSSDICLLNDRYTIRIALAGYHNLSCELSTRKHRTIVQRIRGQKPQYLVSDYQQNDIENFGLIMRTMLDTFGEDPEPKPVIWEKLQQISNACLDRQNKAMTPTAAVLRKRIATLGLGRQSVVELLMGRLQKHAELLEHEVELRSQELLIEMQKVDDLLKEMLPKPVIQQLRNHESVIAELYESATVLFSDIPVFSRMIAECTPMDVVIFLNQIHSAFDAIVSEFDVYKVETINDSYVVVSGIPVRNGEAHATEICRLALQLRVAGGSITVPTWGDLGACPRMGINSGLAATGVVGTRMPRYCLFGDTMNTASRMESHGAANRIHVSGTTRALVQGGPSADEFHFKSRGLVTIKGKGEMETFWLLVPP